MLSEQNTVFKKKTIIIGLGNIGFLYDKLFKSKKSNLSHAKSIVGSKKFKLVCGVDKNLSKRKKFENTFKLPSTSDLKKALSKYSPEIAIVATNNNSHYSIIKVLSDFKSIKNIVLEKPGGRNFNELKNIYSLCQKKDISIIVNYTRLFQPYFKKIAKYLKNKELFAIFQYNRGIANNCSHIISYLLSINFPNKISNININVCGFKNNISIYIQWKNIKCLLINPGIKNLELTKLEIFTNKLKFTSDNNFAEFKVYESQKSKLIKKHILFEKFKLLKNVNKNNELKVFYKDLIQNFNEMDKYKKISLTTSKLIEKLKKYEKGYNKKF